MINIVNTRENNLSNITLSIPNNKLIAVTGVSGSGKSSLVYDVIYKEARRRYLESFSSNARQFLGKLNRADFDFISGLSPAIALEQKQKITASNSTVGTLTEIYDLLRLLFARYGCYDKAYVKELKIDKNLFSFNSPKGACACCKGLGITDAIHEDLLIVDSEKTIREGAFQMTTPSGYIVYSQVTMNVLNEVCNAEGFSVDIPWKGLSAEQKKVVLFGSNKITVPFGKHTLESRMKWTGITAKPREEGYYKGIIPVMDEILKRDRNVNILRFTKSVVCYDCSGKRLNKNALSVNYLNKNIAELAQISINDLHAFFQKSEAEQEVSKGELSIINEIHKTTQIIKKLGLGFLSLKRPSNTLSSGETQRLRLAKMVNSGLRGILYLFDEPSVGLHPKEVNDLVEVLYALRNNGNTVIVVEHNNQLIKSSEWIIDIGPKAGVNGGKVLFNGSSEDFLKLDNLKESKTLKHIRESIKQKQEKTNNEESIQFNEISANNLQSINIQLKVNALNLITGVSGAGKTSLINVISQYFTNILNGNENSTHNFKSVMGDVIIKKIVVVDQAPIGKTPRSNPATYIGLSDELRNLFAALETAKKMGLKKSHFSFNTKGGRCEKCEGAGYLQIGMQMLGTVEVVCDQCMGKQFKPKVLEVKYRDKSLAEIYSMDVDEALLFFEQEPVIAKHLSTLQELGLGYLKLNQRSSTLSGGEARRIKLTKDLVKTKNVPTIYIIDEPSSGLHAHDNAVLLKSFTKLIELGHTLVLSEQNELFLKNADYIIELGEGSGVNGGKVIFNGSPSQFFKERHRKTIREDIIIAKEHTEQIANIKAPIQLKNVTTHNLKGINVNIPSNKLTMVVGVSGSGKSSLVFDTLFAEGRQRYAESFSAYVRNRLNINSQAQFDTAKGLYPTIAVNQKSVSKNDRSTVGTMTDLYDLIRLLYARIGISKQTDKSPMASLFSFNHEQGACTYCQGLGYFMEADEDKLISNANLSITDGAMNSSKPGKFYGDKYGQYVATLYVVGEQNNIDFNENWNDLSVQAKQIVMYGTGDVNYKVNWKFKRKNREGNHEFEGKWLGFLYHINEEYLRKVNDKRADAFLPIMKKTVCKPCNGTRLNDLALSFKINNKSISDLTAMPISQSIMFYRQLLQKPNLAHNDLVKQKAAQVIIGSLMRGLDVLEKLGLEYLSLNRPAKTLSGGEGQRVRLASSLIQDLSGVCFVLDEPTMGLHQKDSYHLMLMLKDLVNQGNTVVVSEHDPYFIKNADHIIELGPKAGKAGGELIAEGSLGELMKNSNSITAGYLKDDFKFNRKTISTKGQANIEIEGASANNLQNINVQIPINRLVAVKGVSGSGKSSLVYEVIYQSYLRQKAMNCKLINGLSNFNQVIWANQESIKPGGLSFIATYLNIYDTIKKLFVGLDKAKKLKLGARHFSLAGKDGCCPMCQGKGVLTTALDFLSDVEEICEECNGQRYNNQVLSCKIENQSIADVLNTPLAEIGDLLSHASIDRVSQLAAKVGLGYITIGQSLKTLSGGELQRLKLLSAILEQKGNNSLILLDEPTMGLHMKDIEHLIEAFNGLISEGHSIIFIEHNQALIKCADYVIEIGPGAGEKGGRVLSAKDN